MTAKDPRLPLAGPWCDSRDQPAASHRDQGAGSGGAGEAQGRRGGRGRARDEAQPGRRPAFPQLNEIERMREAYILYFTREPREIACLVSAMPSVWAIRWRDPRCRARHHVSVSPQQPAANGPPPGAAVALAPRLIWNLTTAGFLPNATAKKMGVQGSRPGSPGSSVSNPRSSRNLTIRTATVAGTFNFAQDAEHARAPSRFPRRVGSICGLAGLRPSVWQRFRGDSSLRR